jgi:5-methylcytosine-specific restriction endonuclease McrA
VTKWRRRSNHRARGHMITALMARDGRHCAICDRPLVRRNRDPESDDYITFDHILPRSMGGLDALSNLRLAHRLCNQRRGDTPVFAEES